MVCFVSTYPLDSDLSGGQRYPAFEQPEPGVCSDYSQMEIQDMDQHFSKSFFLQTLKWHGKIKNLKTAFKSVIIFPFLKLKKKREKKDEDITITPLRTEAEKKVSTSI